MPFDDYERKTHFVKLTWQLRRIKKRDRRLRDNRMAAAQAMLTLFQDKVSRPLNELGVYVDLNHQYLAYAQALDKSQRELRFMVDWIREHQILRDRFERRGLDPTVLSSIDALVIYRTRDL